MRQEDLDALKQQSEGLTSRDDAGKPLTSHPGDMTTVKFRLYNFSERRWEEFSRNEAYTMSNEQAVKFIPQTAEALLEVANLTYSTKTPLLPFEIVLLILLKFA